MEIKLGRKLNRFELVHHKNGDIQDNQLDNLELKTIIKHTKDHLIKIHKCIVCGKENVGSKTYKKMCRKHYRQVKKGKLSLYPRRNL